jgi:hypothetical protein
MSNFGDSSNYESYPYYEPTSQSVQMSSQSDMSNWQRAGWHTQPQNHTAFRKTANGDDPVSIFMCLFPCRVYFDNKFDSQY